jgi:hypothetical protein
VAPSSALLMATESTERHGKTRKDKNITMDFRQL